MLIGLTDEQLALRDTLRTLMERSSPEAEVRRLMSTAEGHDVDAWRRLAQLGLVGIAVPERFGGAGGTLADQGVVLEEMGGALFCGPYFSTTVLAVQALLHVHDVDTVADLLGSIAGGEQLATLAVPDSVDQGNDKGLTTGAEQSADGGWQLRGTQTHVLDGAIADVILLIAGTSRGASLFAVQGNAPGLRRTPLQTMDQTRKQARLDLQSTPARLIGEPGEGWHVVEPALHVAAIALAAEQVGGSRRVLAMVVEHASNRRQFGRPIGSFQAVQHKCASMLVEIEAARSAAYYALGAATRQSEEVAAVAAIAKSFCSESYRHVTDEAIQVLGGIGLTWEHPIHLYFKRARSSYVLLGTPSDHRELLAQQLEL